MRIAVVLALLFVSACALVIGLDPPEGEPLPPLDDAAAADASIDAPDPCVHARPPAAPAVDDDPATELPPFWVVLRATHMADPSRPTPGYDLDGVCTCVAGSAHGGVGSCAPRGNSPAPCDDDGGVDDGTEAIFRTFVELGDPNVSSTLQIATGEQSVLLRVSRYNGRANDGEVGVGVTLSDGLFTSDCDPSLVIRDGGPTTPNDDGYYPPSWRGCDKWHPRKDGVLPTDDEGLVPIQSGAGYVTNGVLVVTGNMDVPFVLGTNGSLNVTSPVVTGRLEQAAPSRFRLVDAVVAGRVAFADFASVLFRSTVEGFYFCQAPEAFATTIKTMCPFIDTTTQPSLDFQPNVACDALSVAVPFDTEVCDVDLDERQGFVDHGPCVDASAPPLEDICPP